MDDYFDNGGRLIAPWASDAAKVVTVIVEAGATKLGTAAFQDCVNLTKVRLPEGLEVLGNHAFFRCLSLTSLHIPDSVTRMGTSACSLCGSLQQVHLPQQLSQVASFTFSRCARLTEIEIPEGVTQIGQGAFNDCAALVAVTVPKTVTVVDKAVFDGSTPAIIAPHIPVGQFHRAIKAQAICGFAIAWAENRPMEQQDREGYLQYIRRQRKRLYPLAMRHQQLLRLMLGEAMVPKKDIPFLLEEAETQQNTAAKEAILNYERKQ